MLISLLFSIPAFLLSFDFLHFISKGKRLYRHSINIILELVGMLLYPGLYLAFLDPVANDCCTDSATFSPDHRLTAYTLVFICILAYLYSRYKSQIESPIVEVVTNSLLLFGFIFNVFVAMHVDKDIWFIGNVPVGLLFVFQLIKAHHDAAVHFQAMSHTFQNGFEKLAYKVITLDILRKIPILLVLLLPILTLIICTLMLFGQKPDSIIRAFTDTYKHGFSQLDHLCDNIQCGGHFLCSVAAKGHKQIVRPIRYGRRHGNLILCNRQLLVANAFEELIQEKLPRTHRLIRHHYNSVGDAIHQHYYLFNYKWLADIVYFLMKPLEIFFLTVLYTFDKKPENRIALQYLCPSDRQLLQKKS